MTPAIDMRFDLTTLRLHPRTMPAALERLGVWLEKRRSTGVLVACLFSEVGIVNQLLLLRAFAGTEQLLEERETALRERDPFAISEFTLESTMDLMAALPGSPAVPPRGIGSSLEVRRDEIKPGRLGDALACWQRSPPERGPVFAFHTLAGAVPEIVHFWPGQTVEPDTDAASDLGPHLGGPANLLARRAEIFRPAVFSPLR